MILFQFVGAGGVNRGDGGATGGLPGNDFGGDSGSDDGIGGIGGNDGAGGSGGPGGVSNNGGGPGGLDDNSIDSDSDGPFGDVGGNRDDFDSNRNRPGDSDLPKRDRGFGTIITNSGDTYFGIAPGASARAHVQNIDLKPFGEDGALSPGEALRRDERRSLRLRFRG